MARCKLPSVDTLPWPRKFARVMGCALRPGYIIANYGHLWRVESVRYDWIGNGTYAKPAPRWVVDASAYTKEAHRAAPSGSYFGCIIDLSWDVWINDHETSHG